MAEALPHMVWTATPDGMVDYVSREFNRYTGLENLDSVGDGWLEGVHPDDREPTLKIWEHAITAGRAYNTEFRIFHKASGQYRWHFVAARPHRHADGHIVKWYGTTTDIHDSKLADKAFRDADTRLKRVMDLQRLETAVLDAISAGAPLLSIFDQVTHSVDAMMPEVASSIMQVVNGRLRHGSAPKLPASYNQVIDGLEIGEGVGSCGTAAARGRPVIVADMLTDPLWAAYRHLVEPIGLRACWSNPVIDAEGRVLATFGMYYMKPKAPDNDDIAFIERISQFVRVAIKRTRQHEKLRISEARFRTVAQATRDVVWDCNPVDDTMWYSDGMKTLYGHDPEHDPALQKASRALDYVHPDDRPKVRELADQALASGTNWHIEHRYQRADGSYAHVLSQGHIVRDDHGTPVRLLGSLTDITEQKLLEEQLRRSQRLEAVGQMTGGVAHDFNNLLTVILGNLEQLQEGLGETHRLRHLADMAAMAADRGAELTSRLLAFARRQPLKPAVLNVNRQIAGMDKLLRSTLGESVQLEIVQAGGLWRALADAPQLESAVLNLCLNARDAMAGGGRLTIETANAYLDANYARKEGDLAPGQYVMVAVSDTGSGMDAKTLARVFEPFFTTKEVGKGSGLGLSMVYGFAKQSSGHVRVYSEPGMGTTVKLYLPRAHESASDGTNVHITAPAQPGHEHILLVEDDELVRQHVTLLLKGLGYQVSQASSGADALEMLERLGTVDLLFTDVVMPGGMTGRQLADAVRKTHPDMPVLFSSGYTENAIVHHGRLDPGVYLLQKPYRRQELARMIREVIDSVRTGKK
jgi:PAS domain S-box-containing protein